MSGKHKSTVNFIEIRSMVLLLNELWDGSQILFH